MTVIKDFSHIGVLDITTVPLKTIIRVKFTEVERYQLTLYSSQYRGRVPDSSNHLITPVL